MCGARVCPDRPRAPSAAAGTLTRCLSLPLPPSAGLAQLGLLQELWLGRNRIAKIGTGLATLHNLRRLSLQSNRLTSMAGLQHCTALEELYLRCGGCWQEEQVGPFWAGGVAAVQMAEGAGRIAACQPLRRLAAHTSSSPNKPFPSLQPQWHRAAGGSGPAGQSEDSGHCQQPNQAAGGVGGAAGPLLGWAIIIDRTIPLYERTGNDDPLVYPA